MYREIKACRSCHSDRLETVLDLGNLCISDFVLPGEPEDRAPLELMVCDDCSLVQLRHTVDRDRLYRDYYYRSGTNESMVAALQDVVADACEKVKLDWDDAVLDIGCNDGTMLRMFPEHCRRDGFEPSNLHDEAREGNDIISHTYFPPKTWNRFAEYKIITSIAMFYDLDDPNEFVEAINRWLHPDGVWVVQFQDLHHMLETNAFDNICHEHLTYWGAGAFYDLLGRHGLVVDDVSHNQVNGGSVRYTIRHGNRHPHRNPAWADEFKLQLGYFTQRVQELREETNNMLWNAEIANKKTLGYGASTKGNTLLQYYGIGPDVLPAIADRNPEKWLRYTVGSGIQIISEDQMRREKPDYLFVLPWHFIDSFIKREIQFLERGGRFMVPLPELNLIGGGPCPSTTGEHSDRTLAATGSTTQ